MGSPTSVRNGASLLLGAAGIGLLGFALYATVDAHLAQRRLAQRLEAASPSRAAAGELRTAVATRREATASGLVGEFEIERLGLSAMITEGISRRALGRGIGHVPNTAFPGEPGNVGLAAHRDTYFRRLKDVAAGDRVRVRTPDGTFTYEVEWMQIVDPSRVELLAPTARPALTLVTCYPFYWIGNAPQRFVVRCRPVGAAPGIEAPPPMAGAARPRSAQSAVPISAPAEDLLDAGADSVDSADESITGENASEEEVLPPG